MTPDVGELGYAASLSQNNGLMRPRPPHGVQDEFLVNLAWTINFSWVVVCRSDAGYGRGLGVRPSTQASLKRTLSEVSVLLPPACQTYYSPRRGKFESIHLGLFAPDVFIN